MKQTGKFTALAAIALTSALFLGACSNGANQSKTASSSTSASSSSVKKTSSSSSKLASSVSESSESETSSVSVSTVESAPVSNQETSEQSQQETTDYAYLAGTWANDEGMTLTIDADGTMSIGAKIEVQKGSGSLAVRFKEGYGASLFYAAAGQEFPERIAPKEYTEGTDISKERLVIAQSTREMAHPYYRVP